MNRRSIQGIIRRVLRRRGGAALAALPQQLQEHARTGQPPADPLAKSYIALTESALASMDQSIGGDEYTAACEKYIVALENWQRTLKENGV